MSNIKFENTVFDDFVEYDDDAYISDLSKDVSIYNRKQRNKRNTGSSCYNTKHTRIQQGQKTKQ